MTAISKAWVTIADTAVDPDSPLDAALMTGLRDNDVHLREWLGASFTAGAVQDHNHDGSNSATIEIGPSLVRNGSFESGTVGWTETQYTGGTVATNTSNDMDGATALAFTSTVLANGGGEAISNEFVACTGDADILVKFAVKAGGANVSSKVDVLWYDDAQASVSTTTVFSTTSTNTALKKRQRIAKAPSTARFFKIKLIGGVPSSGASTGTIYFDGIKVTEPQGALILLDELTASTSAQLDFTEGIDATFAEYKFEFSNLKPASAGADLRARISTDGGSTFITTASYYSDAAAAGYFNLMTGVADGYGGVNGSFFMASLPGAATNHPTAMLDAINVQGGPAYATKAAQFVYYATPGAVNAVRFYMSSVNLGSGSIRLYGVRKGA